MHTRFLLGHSVTHLLRMQGERLEKTGLARYAKHAKQLPLAKLNASIQGKMLNATRAGRALTQRTIQ